MLNIKIINKSEYEAPKYETEQSAGVDLRANIDEEICWITFFGHLC